MSLADAISRADRMTRQARKERRQATRETKAKSRKSARFTAWNQETKPSPRYADD